jgi:hypothetical protein
MLLTEAAFVLSSLPHIQLRLSSNQKKLELVVVPAIVPAALASLSEYVEAFNLDGSDSHWNMRRDMKLGRTIGQVFQTTDDILITR